MWIKLDNENIVGHTYENISDGTGYDIQIPTQVLVDLSTGYYKYKWDGVKLVEMIKVEIDAHPLVIRAIVELKLKELFEKEAAKAEKSQWQEVKKVQGLTAQEIAVIDEKIAALDAKLAKSV